jgi:hypothetical protein
LADSLVHALISCTPKAYFNNILSTFVSKVASFVAISWLKPWIHFSTLSHSCYITHLPHFL